MHTTERLTFARMTTQPDCDMHGRYMAAEGVRARRIGNETMVLVMSTGHYLSLNATGSIVWEQLLRGATPAEVASSVAQSFSIPPEQAASDVNHVMADLLLHRVVVAAPAAEA